MVNPLATTGSLPNLPCYCKVNAAAWKNQLLCKDRYNAAPKFRTCHHRWAITPARLVGLCIPKKAKSTANDRRTWTWNTAKTNGLAPVIPADAQARPTDTHPLQICPALGL
jgi:hypothetical protein